MAEENKKDELKTCHCPTCGKALNVLLFMGVQPEGYVCTGCKLFYSPELKPLATVI